VEKPLSEALLTRFQVANPHESDVALKKAGVAYCAARAFFIKGHFAPPATADCAAGAQTERGPKPQSTGTWPRSHARVRR